MPSLVQGKGAQGSSGSTKTRRAPIRSLENLVKGGSSRGLEETFKAIKPDAEALPWPWGVYHIGGIEMKQGPGPPFRVPTGVAVQSAAWSWCGEERHPWVLCSCRGHHHTCCWTDSGWVRTSSQGVSAWPGLREGV